MPGADSPADCPRGAGQWGTRVPRKWGIIPWLRVDRPGVKLWFTGAVLAGKQSLTGRKGKQSVTRPDKLCYRSHGARRRECKWWARQDLNLQEFPHVVLSHARLPFRHSPTTRNSDRCPCTIKPAFAKSNSHPASPMGPMGLRQCFHRCARRLRRGRRRSETTAGTLF